MSEAELSDDEKALVHELRVHVVGLGILVDFMKKNGIHRLRTAEGVEIEFESKWAELASAIGPDAPADGKPAPATQPAQAANGASS
jgi:hypothetical protein